MLDPAAVRGVLERGLAEGAYAGAVALVLHRGTVALELALGQAQTEPAPGRPITSGTVFDLASLTKVVAGVTAALLLRDRGLWSLDDPVARFIPPFAAHGKGTITLRQLLSHTAGLPAWRPLYLAGTAEAGAQGPEGALAALCALEPEATPGTRVQYSDLGPALIGYLVRAAAGEQLPALLEREVFGPLGMTATRYLPPDSWRPRCAATARGNAHERALVGTQGASFAGWREGVLVGEVHDGNAHHALGGVSGHAGLFSTARDLGHFAALYLAQGYAGGRQVLSAASLREATLVQTGRLRPPYGLGWRLAEAAADRPRGMFMGQRVSHGAFGHTGFTGTSLVIDPARALAMILLTNAVHVDPEREGIARVRPAFHDAVCAAPITTG